MNLSWRLLLVFALLVPLATFAQDNSGLAAKIESLRFSQLTRMAMIQGDVRLRSGPDGVMVISGNPLLAEIAGYVGATPTLMRDEAKESFVSVPKTDAWRDDNQNAHYVMECTLLSPDART